MKNKLVLIVVLFFALLVVSIIIYIVPRPVTFSFEKDMTSINLLTSSGSTKHEGIKNGDTLWISPGEYTATTSDDRFNSDGSIVKISRAFSQSIQVDIPFHDEYINKITSEASDEATILLHNKYPGIIDDYAITNAKLFNDMEWYGAILYNTSSTRDTKRDSYRFVMKKENNKWKIINRPTLILDKDFSSIPKEVRDYLNSLNV